MVLWCETVCNNDIVCPLNNSTVHFLITLPLIILTSNKIGWWYCNQSINLCWVLSWASYFQTQRVCMISKWLTISSVSIWTGYHTCFWHVLCGHSNPREEGVALLHLLPKSRTSRYAPLHFTFKKKTKKENLSGNNLMQVFRERTSHWQSFVSYLTFEIVSFGM